MAKVARWTLVYYAATTFTAVVLGMVLVTVMNPGRGSPLDGNVANCAGAQVLPVAWVPTHHPAAAAAVPKLGFGLYPT